MQDAFNQTVIIADGFHEQIALHEEQISPIDQFLRELSELAREAEGITRSHIWRVMLMNDAQIVFEAAKQINKARDRLEQLASESF